ncbi:hypothetical protein SUGI_0873280 [Cryptomeria japonica]|nr:hypothetical protein SUGI_0873280 [Cryptomeria japonica]
MISGGVIIVDDNSNTYDFFPNNAVPVSSFVDDVYDRELSNVVSFFKVVQDYEDLREAIHHYFVRVASFVASVLRFRCSLDVR